MSKLNLHPLCTFFPRMEGAEFEALKADIKANGLRHRIVVHKGMILDGGNRYAACLAVGVTPSTMDYNGSDPVAYVLSANLHRRHMTAGQQAAIVAAAADWSKAQKHGGDRKSDQGAALHLGSVADRAAQSGASVRTQKDADKVARADPELAREVAHGKKSLPQAVEQLAGKRATIKPQPVAAPEPDEGPTAAEVMDEQERLIQKQQEQIDALSATDQAKELLKQIELRKLAERARDDEMDKNARLLREKNLLERFRTEVIKAVGASDPKDALARIRARPAA